MCLQLSYILNQRPVTLNIDQKFILIYLPLPTTNSNTTSIGKLLSVLMVCRRRPSAASSTTGPESVSERDGMQLPSKSPSSWSIEEVMQFVRDADPTALAPHAELFRKHVGFLLLCWPVYVLNLGAGEGRRGPATDGDVTCGKSIGTNCIVN